MLNILREVSGGSVGRVGLLPTPDSAVRIQPSTKLYIESWKDKNKVKEAHLKNILSEASITFNKKEAGGGPFKNSLKIIHEAYLFDIFNLGFNKNFWKVFKDAAHLIIFPA